MASCKTDFLCTLNKELKLTIKPVTGCTLGDLLIQMQNISLQSSGMRRKQNFSTAVLTFTFRFLSLPFFLLFLPHFFFFCWACSRFHFGGKVCTKAFRILELDERKDTCRQVVEQDFLGNFQVNGTWFFCLFLWCPWLSWAYPGLIWKISSLCTT